MGHRRFAAQWLKLLAVAGLAGSALVGCGEDGKDGAAGPSGVFVAPVANATSLTIAITSAKVASRPVVNFKVIDQNGASVTGLAPGDLRFNIAKLVPGTYGNPSNWQNYIYRASGGVYGNQERSTTSSGYRYGTLNDHGDGTYTYTFSTDITNPADIVCPSPCTDANGTALDLRYQPNVTHRVTIQQANSAYPRYNATYDFVPAGGAVFGREIVKTSKCNECHSELRVHGSRVETKLCVTCHNPGSWVAGSPNTTVDFKVMVHKIHMSEHLPSVESGGSYKIGTADFSEVKFPQDVRNCTKCHDGSDPATPQGSNWQLQPSREACGACHDNVNFETGVGHAGGPKDNSTCLACHSTGGMVGSIATSHIPVAPPNPDNYLVTGSSGGAYTNAAWIAAFPDKLPAGAIKITYDVKEVKVVGNQPVIVFKLKADGTDVVFNNPASATEMMANFIGSPGIYFAWAVPQDGINPADFNNNNYVYLKTIWNGTATGSRAGTIAGPDADGYYTVTATGFTIPAAATMAVGGVGFTYALNSTLPLTQTNVPGYPSPDPAQTNATYPNGVPNTGGLIVQAPVAWKNATGFTARRTIVQNANCNACHAQLGVTPTYHAGQRNDASTCAWCHNPDRTSSGWSARSSSFVHAIHAAGKRTENFNWHAASATEGFWKIAYPGILNKCETCHVAGAYDYSGSAYTATFLDNQLYSYVATNTSSGPLTASVSLSPYVVAGTDYGTAFDPSGPTQATANTLVTSPIATACFACHDSSPAKAHMESVASGGSIYAARGTSATLPVEPCLICHGPGKFAAIAEMHAR
jgi:OmcA/MtrC family decaheme c-type cytochrome